MPLPLFLRKGVSLPRPNVGAYHREEFDPARRTILYCASGGRSALAADTLQTMGYADVAHLDGGIKAWKEDDDPVEVRTGQGGHLREPGRGP